MAPQAIPTLVGHRGWPEYWPENTLEGFSAAVAAGARWLECDVQLSADNVPFVCHDVSLKRTAGLDREITGLAAADLDAIKVGDAARFGTHFAGVRLPRLSAVVTWLCAQASVRLFVEIKRQSLHHHGTQPVVNAVMADLQPALKQCVLISFDHTCLSLARQRGATAVGWAAETIAGQTKRQATDLRPEYLLTDEKLFARMRGALPGPWQWIVYHTESTERILELAGQGAHMVETNDIGTLLADPRLHQQ